jgi:hypothetical protein
VGGTRHERSIVLTSASSDRPRSSNNRKIAAAATGLLIEAA